MKSPIFLVFTDVHLKPDNIQQVICAMSETIDVCLKYKMKHVLCLGDVFDDRVSQRQEVLLAWNRIIKMFQVKKITLHVLRGNHDTSNYQIDDTFLDTYGKRDFYDLISTPQYRKIEDKDCYFLPFYLDDILVDELNENLTNKKGFLFGHFAVQGSHVGLREINSTISRSLFDSFDRVFLGHIHDHCQLNDVIVHLGSLFQNDYSEDYENKGLWLIYDDGAYKNIPIKSGQCYKKVTIDLDVVSKKQLEVKLRSIREQNHDCRLRIELQGSKANLQSFDKSKYSELGIDFKKKCKEFETIDCKKNEIKTLTEEDVCSKFKEFCKQKELNFEQGFEILLQLIKS